MLMAFTINHVLALIALDVRSTYGKEEIAWNSTVEIS